MDRLTAMQTFVRVAELGSLSAAARDLLLSQSAVSQQISALELRLGVRLLHRSTRGLSLTDVGNQFLSRTREILAALQEAEEGLEASDAALEGSVRVQAPSGFGQLHVAPQLIALKARHPGLAIDLVLDDRLADMIGEGVDVAVRLGVPSQPELVVRRLGQVGRVLIASPHYARLHRLPQEPADLIAHPFIRFSWMASGDKLTLIGAQGSVTVPTRVAMTSNNAFVVIDAVRAGVGIGATQRPLVHQMLEAGELVQVLPDYHYPPLELHAVYPSRRFIPRRVHAVIDHLAACLPAIAGLV